LAANVREWVTSLVEMVPLGKVFLFVVSLGSDPLSILRHSAQSNPMECGVALFKISTIAPKKQLAEFLGLFLFISVTSNLTFTMQ